MISLDDEDPKLWALWYYDQFFFLSPYIEITPCSLDCKKNKVADPENG